MRAVRATNVVSRYKHGGTPVRAVRATNVVSRYKHGGTPVRAVPDAPHVYR